MTKKEKETKEFFEVFKMPDNQKEIKQRDGLYQRSQTNPSFIPRPRPEVSRESVESVEDDKKKGQLNWIKDTKNEESLQPDKKKNRRAFLNEVVIKQEVLILSALGAVFLSLACFFTGYKIGYNKAMTPEVYQEPVAEAETRGVDKSLPREEETRAAGLSEKSPNVTNIEGQSTNWTLRIITYDNTKQNMKKAANLAKAIKEMTGYKTFVAKRGKELVVCAGRFDSWKGDSIKSALNEIVNLEYEGKKQFLSSYPIQIR